MTALEREFRELCCRLEDMSRAVGDLRVCIRVDRPARGDVVLVDTLGDRADDLSALLTEASGSAAAGYREAIHPIDAGGARLALALCQERFNAVAQRFASELAAYEVVSDLARAGHERGGEWPGWASSVRDALGRCQPLIDEVNRALLACWEDLAERAGTGSHYVQSTTIGNRSGTGEADRLAAG
jgi:hypothetical protein